MTSTILAMGDPLLCGVPITTALFNELDEFAYTNNSTKWQTMAKTVQAIGAAMTIPTAIGLTLGLQDYMIIPIASFVWTPAALDIAKKFLPNYANRIENIQDKYFVFLKVMNIAYSVIAIVASIAIGLNSGTILLPLWYITANCISILTSIYSTKPALRTV